MYRIQIILPVLDVLLTLTERGLLKPRQTSKECSLLGAPASGGLRAQAYAQMGDWKAAKKAMEDGLGLVSGPRLAQIFHDIWDHVVLHSSLLLGLYSVNSDVDQVALIPNSS